MTALLAGACAAGAVLAALHRMPRPLRVAGPPRRPIALGPAHLARRCGRQVRSAAGLRPDDRLDRRAGVVVALVGVGLAAGIELALGLGLAMAVRSRWRQARSAATVDDAQVERDLPDLVDLLSLAVGAGLSVPAALPVVAPVAPAALRDQLAAVADAIAAGRPSDEAVAGLAAAWGPVARPLVHALADHLRYGTPVLPALERVAGEARTRRRRAAETRARKLPVLLLFPLVLCTLPAFGLLTVAPLVAGTFDSLSGGHLEAPASLGP